MNMNVYENKCKKIILHFNVIYLWIVSLMILLKDTIIGLLQVFRIINNLKRSFKNWV
jgi:hypothetical protein